METTLAPLVKANGQAETLKEMLDRGVALKACSGCLAVGAADLKRCGKCRSAYAAYCSRECQRAHWKTHRKVCGTDDPCPLCMERGETDGRHRICFVCGFVSCEACGPEWTRWGGCPRCGERCDDADLARTARALLEKKPSGPHRKMCLSLLGDWYLRGAGGAKEDREEALRYFQLAFDEGNADAGLMVVNLLEWKLKAEANPARAIIRATRALERLERALAIEGRDAMTAANRKTAVRLRHGYLERYGTRYGIRSTDALVAANEKLAREAEAAPPAPPPAPVAGAAPGRAGVD